MDREQKIKLLDAIKRGQLPKDALKVECGIYRKVENDLFRHDSGFEISCLGLSDSIKYLPFVLHSVKIEGEETPLLIMISPFPIGVKTFAKSQIIETSNLETMRKHWENCGLTASEIEKMSKAYPKPEEITNSWIEFFENEFK